MSTKNQRYSLVGQISLLVIGCVVLAGCSENNMAQVAGRVVYADDGTVATALAGHQVSFIRNPTEDDVEKMRISATGVIKNDGTFTMSTYEMEDGVVLGDHQVAITVPFGFDGVAAIPDRYGNPKQSGLDTTIEGGDTEVVLKVERAP